MKNNISLIYHKILCRLGFHSSDWFIYEMLDDRIIWVKQCVFCFKELSFYVDHYKYKDK